VGILLPRTDARKTPAELSPRNRKAHHLSYDVEPVTRREADLRMASRIVQPYGRGLARESELISEHAMAIDAFAEIDRLAAQMVRSGVRPTLCIP
jgi:hypothetical protein